MRLLVDTHVLLWAATSPGRLGPRLRRLLEDPGTEAWFSAASIWEVQIKASLGPPDFAVSPRLLRRGLLDGGWRELTVSGEHALELQRLPDLHRDPFDRILVAQARVEGWPLWTADRTVLGYGDPVVEMD